MRQILWNERKASSEILAWLQAHDVHSVFLVHGHSATSLFCYSFFQRLTERGITIRAFTSFLPNPQLVSAKEGEEACRAAGCDMIVAIGGGSAMDVAKVVKLLLMREGKKLPLLVVPTTAGTGSEATHFAVVYQDGVKQSVQDACILPEAVWFLPENLRGLPHYQRQATALDAFCHAFESYWSVHADAASQKLAWQALVGIQSWADGYVRGEQVAEARMMRMANLAGRAIDLTQTTAGHAMCYELSHLAGISHGHAAALCVDAICTFLVKRRRACPVLDSRGALYLEQVLEALQPAWRWLHERLTHWEMRDVHVDVPSSEAVHRLVESVHLPRLRNFPYQLVHEDFAVMYRAILEGKNGSK